MKRLAASSEVMPASASSLTSRSCRVRKARSERPRLRGIGRDVLDAELGQRPPHLGGLLPRDPAAGGRRVEVCNRVHG